MTRECIETGKEIINPYVNIFAYNKKSKKHLELDVNVSAFEKCSKHIIHPFNYEKRKEIDLSDKYVFKIWAIVGEYNSPLDDTSDYKNVSALETERGKIYMGRLEEKIIKENLPNFYKLVEKETNNKK